MSYSLRQLFERWTPNVRQDARFAAWRKQFSAAPSAGSVGVASDSANRSKHQALPSQTHVRRPPPPPQSEHGLYSASHRKHTTSTVNFAGPSGVTPVTVPVPMTLVHTSQMTQSCLTVCGNVSGKTSRTDVSPSSSVMPSSMSTAAENVSKYVLASNAAA